MPFSLTPVVRGHAAAVYKRPEAVLDASEQQEGQGQDRVCPASLKMSSLPFLQILLLLLALHTPRTQGYPLTTRKYHNEFKELEDILSKTPLPSQVSSWDKAGMGQAGQAGASGQQDSWALFPSSPTEARGLK